MLHKSLFLSLSTVGLAWAWTAPLRPLAASPRTARPVLTARFMVTDSDSSEDTAAEQIERTSFDQAGASLIEEEDQKRMQEMGDFDTNDAVGVLWCQPAPTGLLPAA